MTILPSIGTVAALVAGIGFGLSATLDPGTALRDAAVALAVLGAFIAVLSFGSLAFFRGG